MKHMNEAYKKTRKDWFFTYDQVNEQFMHDDLLNIDIYSIYNPYTNQTLRMNGRVVAGSIMFEIPDLFS